MLSQDFPEPSPGCGNGLMIGAQTGYSMRGKVQQGLDACLRQAHLLGVAPKGVIKYVQDGEHKMHRTYPILTAEARLGVGQCPGELHGWIELYRFHIASQRGHAPISGG